MNFSNPMIEKTQLQHSLIQEFLDSQSESDKLNVKLLMTEEEKKSKSMEEVCENLINYVKGVKESTLNRLVENLSKIELSFNQEFFSSIPNFVLYGKEKKIEVVKEQDEIKNLVSKKKKKKNKSKKTSKKESRRNSNLVITTTSKSKSKEETIQNVKGIDIMEIESKSIKNFSSHKNSPKNLNIVRRRSSSINIFLSNSKTQKKQNFEEIEEEKRKMRMRKISYLSNHLKGSEESDSLIQDVSIARKKFGLKSPSDALFLGMNTSWESYDDTQNMDKMVEIRPNTGINKIKKMKKKKKKLNTTKEKEKINLKKDDDAKLKNRRSNLMIKTNTMFSKKKTKTNLGIGIITNLENKNKISINRKPGGWNTDRNHDKRNSNFDFASGSFANITKRRASDVIKSVKVFHSAKKGATSFLKKKGEICDISFNFKNGDKNIHEFSRILRGNENLRILKLRGNGISDIGALNLISVIMDLSRNLEVLDLSQNLITEKFLIMLNKIDLSGTKLGVIELKGCGILGVVRRTESLLESLKLKGINIVL